MRRFFKGLGILLKVAFALIFIGGLKEQPHGY
jgi:hypothetical protein